MNPLHALNPATVRRIQERCGMSPEFCDGEMGPQTLRAIDETLAQLEHYIGTSTAQLAEMLTGLKRAGFNIGETPIPAPVQVIHPEPAQLSAGEKAEAIAASFQKIGGQSLAQLIVLNAAEELGVREKGGANKGPRVQEFQSSTWLEGTGWAWCAAFVCFVIRDAVNQLGAPVKFKRPQTAGAWDFERWAKENKAAGVHLFKPTHEKKIRAGDIVVFTFSHIGIAAADQEAGHVLTIEGNTGPDGGRDGDGVYKKRRALSVIRSAIRLPQ